MNTFVWRDIIDKSISGDKIFGGTINWIDGLYTDALYVPHSGTVGISIIDGSGVIIGFNEKIGGLYTEVAVSNYIGVPATVGYAATISAISGMYGAILLKGIGANNIYLNAGGISYITPKLIIGANSLWTSSNLFEVHGTMETQSLVVRAGYALSAVSANINSLNFIDHNLALRNLTEVTTDLDFLIDLFTSTGVLQKPWSDINNWNDNVAAVLSTIPVLPFGIGIDQWGYLSDLDQPLSSADSVNFSDLTLTTFLEIGTVLTYAGSSLEIDKDQFEYLAGLGDSGIFGDIQVDSIKIGGADASNQLSLYKAGTANVAFNYNSSAYGVVRIDYQIVGDIVTLFIKSEGYDPGHPPEWDSVAPVHPTNFLIYQCITASVNSHFEINIGTAFGGILTPAGTAIESATYLNAYKCESDGSFGSVRAIAYMGSDGFLKIKKVNKAIGAQSYRYYHSTLDPLYDDFDLINTEQILIPKSFSVIYRLV